MNTPHSESASSPFLGIDFGTTNSSMGWVDPASGRAELIHNAEGERETPSIVYFGEDEIRVGRAAEHTLDNDAAEEEELQRVVTSIKRHLISPPQITLPGGQYKRPVEVVCEILAKLKRDAETGHFAKEVTHAVITCPALFDTLQRNVIIEAAGLAGFAEVEMLDEPVAAALGFARGGQQVGKGVLVYDLGGGTFDLAFVKREDNDTFDLAMDTEGKADCGGDDFDQLLYDYWDHQARKDLGRSISLANTTINRPFLRQCRLRKETLSTGKQCVFSTTLSDGQVFKPTIDRDTFEELIRVFIEETVRQTKHMWQRAQDRGYEVDTLLLVGGSARIPLVNRLLEGALPLIPRRWHHQDVAVALGAACYAQKLWGTKLKPAPAPGPKLKPEPTPEPKPAEPEPPKAKSRDDSTKKTTATRSKLNQSVQQGHAAGQADDRADSQASDSKSDPGRYTLKNYLALGGVTGAVCGIIYSALGGAAVDVVFITTLLGAFIAWAWWFMSTH